MHGAAMGTDDRHTHRQAKSHVAFAVAGVPSNRSGSSLAGMPRPLSCTTKTASLPSRRTERLILVVVPPCMAAFSSRLESTCSIRIASMGTSSSSSSAETATWICGKRLRNLYAGRLLLLGKLLAFSANAGDGQQVLHQPDQPLGLFPRILQEGALLLRRQAGGLEHGRGRPRD